MIIPKAYYCDIDITIRDLLLAATLRDAKWWPDVKIDQRIKRGDLVLLVGDSAKNSENYQQDYLFEGWLFTAQTCEKIYASSQLFRIYFKR